MKKEENHNGQRPDNWREELLDLESSVCEGLQWSKLFGKRQNIFGRSVLQQKNEDLSYVSGLAFSGLRVSALLDQGTLQDSLKQIKNGIRQNLSLTVHIDKSELLYGSLKTNLSNPELYDLRTLQLISSSPQEAIDFSLIAHKVSEIALIPTIHQICGGENGKISSLSNSKVISFLGNPEDWIDSPTPAQNIIFGPKRRRIPQWFNLDTSGLLGVQKDLKPLARENAAQEVYFENHLEQILFDSFSEYEKITGRKNSFISSYEAEKSPYLIITVGNNPERASLVIDELKRNKVKVGLLNINVINPFPYNKLSNLISGKKAVTVMQPSGNNSSWLVSKIRELASLNKAVPEVITGRYNGQLSVNDLIAAGVNMVSKAPKKHFHCDISFTREISHYPKYKVILQEIERNYPELKSLNLNNEVGKNSNESHSHPFGAITRQYKDLGPPFTQLSGFHDSTAIFYKDGRGDEIVADPLQAIPSIPAASSSLFSPTEKRTSIPVINPENCTACGSCMVQCPYTALPSVSIRFEDLIKAGIKIVSDSGTQIIGLLPMVKNFAKAASKVVSDFEGHPLVLQNILDSAFNMLIEQTKLAGEKLQKTEHEYKAVSNALSRMPITFSESLYYTPESQQKGNGEVFFITVDPNACTGCGLCAKACEDEAIEMVPESDDTLIDFRKKMDLWEKLPDTSPETINRLLFDKNYDSFAALLLSRSFYYSLLGGDSLDNEAASRQLVHLVSAVTESLVQPRYSEVVKTLEELIIELSENIHELLSESLPTENFDNIAKAIENTSSSKVPFDEIINNISKQDRLKQVDARDIKRKIELYDALKALKWSIIDGPTGTGRARSALNISGQNRYEWAKSYPHNPFISPVLAWESEYSTELTQGIIDGQTRNIVDNLKLIRKARLEIKNKYSPGEHDSEIAKLDWEGLTEDEKKLMPPVILIASSSSLKKNDGLESIDKLLAKESPVKILLLNDLTSVPEVHNLISLISLQKAFVFQGSIADPQLLFDGLVHGLSSSSSALFHIFCPDPDSFISRDTSWKDLCSLSLNCRAFPFVKFNPEKYEGFLTNCISMEGNPSPEKSWISQTLDYKGPDGFNSINFDVTWADWAYTLESWKDHFEEYTDSDAIPIAEYLFSDSKSGVPVIYRVKDEKLISYKVSSEIIEQTRSIKESWDLLRELSGDLIPFPEKLRKQVEDDVRKEYEAELERMKAEYESTLKAKEQEQVAAIRKKLRDKLIELTSRNK